MLRFEPPQRDRGGRHELEVKLIRRKGRVHQRKTYFTPRRPVSKPPAGSKPRVRP